jgi:hypothetical protein
VKSFCEAVKWMERGSAAVKAESADVCPAVIALRDICPANSDAGRLKLCERCVEGVVEVVLMN